MKNSHIEAMVTHWESSRRPLYVRTIWKDGQHHVILDKSKETLLETQTKRSKHWSSSKNSHRSGKSTLAGVNLKVSSVRVLLSGVNGFKKNQRTSSFSEKVLDEPNIWTKPSHTSGPLTYRNLNKEVAFNVVQGVKPPNLSRANTVDSEYYANKTLESRLVVPNNALSERVMVWLDLATQNGQNYKEATQIRDVTAQACHILEKPVNNCAKSLDEDRNICIQETVNSSILKNATPRQENSNSELRVYSNEEDEGTQGDFYQIISSQAEKNCEREERLTGVENSGSNIGKRQLHIFIPNLPKGSSDCDSSIFSSKISIS